MATVSIDAIPNSGEDTSPSKRYLTEYYQKLGRFCDEAFEEAKSYQKEVPEIKGIQQTLDYLCGMQWKEALPSYRAKPVSNEVLANFWETIGLLTDIKPTWNIRAMGLPGDFSQNEKILNALSLGWAKQSRFNRHMAFWAMFAMMTTAPAKIWWNLSAHGDGGDPDDADITLEALPTTSLLRLGSEGTLQDDECVIERRVRTLAWIKRNYPNMGRYVASEEHYSQYTSDLTAPPIISPELFEQLSPQMKRYMSGHDRSNVYSVYPKATVLEYWLKDDCLNDSREKVWMGPKGASWGYWVFPGQKLYPRGRVIVRANRIILYDEPNPYFHRKKPYVNLALYDVPWQRYALSVISPWMKQQDILNEIMAGVLDCTKKALRPALMAPKSAIHPDALRAIDSSKPNLKISYNSNAAQPPVWSQPPNIGNYPLPVYQMIEKSMKRGSGAAAMDEVANKKQVPGGETLDRITFGKTTSIRMMAGNVETAIDQVGEMWVANALQFYDAGRRVGLLGMGGLAKEDMDELPGSMIPANTRSEEYVRKYHFLCEKGSLLNFQKQDRIQVGFALRKARDLSRRKLFQMLDWNINQEENDLELKAEAMMMAQAMQAAGVQPGAKGHK